MSRPCLNFSRTWAEVGNIVTSTDSVTKKPNGWVKDAFRNGIADKVLIPRGTPLYKFNAFASLIGKEEGVNFEAGVMISPWWSSYNRFSHVWSQESGLKGMTDDPGWLMRKKMAAAQGLSIREWGRITSVIKENWSSLEYLMVIKLNVDAYGWFGGFASMGRLDKGATSRRLAGETSAFGKGTTRTYSSPGMQERIAKVGNHGTLAGGATQFYIPNIRMSHVASWNAEDLKRA